MTSFLVQQMRDVIQSGYGHAVTLRALSRTFGRHPAYLSSLFQNELGLSAREYLTRVRLERADELIRCGVKIEAVALIVGYRSKKNFYRQFKRQFGTTPAEHRRRHPEARRVSLAGSA